jgi:hypothetical protein
MPYANERTDDGHVHVNVDVDVVVLVVGCLRLFEKPKFHNFQRRWSGVD